MTREDALDLALLGLFFIIQELIAAEEELAKIPRSTEESRLAGERYKKAWNALRQFKANV